MIRFGVNRAGAVYILCAACLLGGCGGGGEVVVYVDEEANTSSPVELATPTPATDDGAPSAPLDPLASPVEAPAAGPAPVLVADDCRAPRASAQGVAHGKPPVGRCDG